jgi:hypothetical protein
VYKSIMIFLGAVFWRASACSQVYQIKLAGCWTIAFSGCATTVCKVLSTKNKINKRLRIVFLPKVCYKSYLGIVRIAVDQNAFGKEYTNSLFLPKTYSMLKIKDLFGAGKQLDDKTLDMLTNSIEQNNLPGFDYYEFKRSVAMLSEMLEEPIAFKSAFQTATTMGVTKEKLLETAQYYRNLMDTEKANFAVALEKQKQLRITDRQKEIDRLKDQISRHESDITRLQTEVADYKAKIEHSETQLKGEVDRLGATQLAFDQTVQSVALTIDSDIEKIHKNLA